ncbi:MAG: insulinase family protein, partial [Planctomycetota bacterium]
NDDPRGRALTPEQVNAQTLDAAQQWLNDILKTGPIEATIVGDLNRDQALQLALKYLGALPNRKTSDGELKKLRQLNLKSGAQEATVEVETVTPRAIITCGWRGADWKEVKDRRVLQIAAQILNSRLRVEIREKRSLTYSIGCDSDPARVYPGTGTITAEMTADPEKAVEACQLVVAVMKQFAQDGPTDEEMDTVRKQLKNNLETMQKEPRYWFRVLSDLEYRGTKLSDVKELLEKMMSYTKKDILKVMKKYIRDDNRIQVIATPKKVIIPETKLPALEKK